MINFIISVVEHVEWPPTEAVQQNLPAEVDAAAELICGRGATAACQKRLVCLSADLCCRSRHACGRRPYDRSGLTLTLPTRDGSARAPFAGSCHRRLAFSLRCVCLSHSNVGRPDWPEDVPLAGPS